MEANSEIYDAWLGITHTWGQQSLYLMFQKYSATVSCMVLSTGKA